MGHFEGKKMENVEDLAIIQMSNLVDSVTFAGVLENLVLTLMGYTNTSFNMTLSLGRYYSS